MAVAAPNSNPVRPAQWVADELVAARLFDPLQLSPYLSEFRMAQSSGDAPALARFLVDAGLLSKFQAERTLAGEASLLVLGPYTLVEPVGAGSLGTVYQAVSRTDRKRYAVKVLPLRSLWKVQQAKQQVLVFANLPSHPAVVPFVDVDTSGGFHYLVWPFGLGHPLAELVRRQGPWPAAEAIRIAAQVAEGLLLCHGHDVSHGLLKPSNILIGNDGQARLLDFGIGAILSENIADSESMLDTFSTANSAQGLLDCAAPETFEAPTLRTPTGDVYSFGCTLYFLLTGGLPFPDGNAVDKLLAHQSRTPPPIRTLNDSVPEWLEVLIARMMAKEAAERPATADVLAALLAEDYAPLTETVRLTDFELATPLPANSTPMLPPPAARRPVAEPPVEVTAAERTETNLPRPDPAPPSDPTLPVIEPPPTEAVPMRVSVPAKASHPAMRALPPLDPPAASESDLQIAESLAALPPPRAARSPLGWLKKKLGMKKLQADRVQLSIFGPLRISPGESVALQVFAHMPEAFDSVKTLAKVFHQNGELLATGFVQRAVALGEPMTLHLGTTGAGVDRPMADLIWQGQPQPRKFDLYIPWESPPGPSPTVLSAGLNQVLAARIPFTLQILRRKA